MKKGILLAAISCIVCAVCFGCLSYWEYRPVLIAENKKEILNGTVVKQGYVQINPKEDDDTYTEKKEDKKENLNEENVSEDMDASYDRRIDFDILHNINQDIAGWIYIPGTSIDYPILIGDTDDMYLYKDFEGNDSKLGSVFSYADTSLDLSDARTVLFGHNMSQYAMFGELKRYVQEDTFRTEHKKMYLYTQNRTMEFEIFSIFVCKNTDSVLYDDVEIGSLEYQELLQELIRRNQYPDIGNQKVDELYNSKSLTLVTCRGRAGTTKRLVINCIVSKEKYILS